MRVIILGKGAMLANLIEGSKDFNIVGVFRYERILYSPFKLFIHDLLKPSNELTLIKKYKLHEIKCKSANSETFRNEIIKLNADVIIMGTWREKLKKEIYNTPTIATINVHPSLLPNYRGPNPYLQTILHGEKESGVTFHLVTEKYDEGPIIAQEKIEILPIDTSKELKEKSVYKARLMVKDLLHRLQTEIIKTIPQGEGTYYPNISGDEKMLNFKIQNSEDIINTIRALNPFLPTYITIDKTYLVVNPYKIEVTNNKGSAGSIINKSSKTRSLTICCKDGISIKFSDLKLYRSNKFLTQIYISKLKNDNKSCNWSRKFSLYYIKSWCKKKLYLA